MEKTIYTEEYLDSLVCDWYLEYAAAGIEVGDPLYEWDNAHHPKSKKLGGTVTVPLMRKHHAIHGVIQSEVYQYPCISTKPWERSYLEGEFLDLHKKWHTILSKMGAKEGGQIGGKKTVEEKIGIHNPEYRESKEYKSMVSAAGRRGAEKGAGKPGRKTLEAKKGIFDPVYRESQEWKDILKRNAENSKKKNSKPVICIETGISYLSSREAAKAVGCQTGHIGRSAKSGGRNSAAGLHWVYFDGDRTP